MSNIVTTKQAQQSATAWFKALTKKFGVRVGIEETPLGVFMDKNFGTTAMSGDAMRKMDQMFSYMRTGFNTSKQWTRDTDASIPFYVDKFTSSDGRYKVILRKQYCGSGGWKVATMYFAFTMLDMHAKVEKQMMIG